MTSGINWLSDEKYNMLKSKMRMKFNGMMKPLRTYGQAPLVDMAIDEAVNI